MAKTIIIDDNVHSHVDDEKIIRVYVRQWTSEYRKHDFNRNAESERTDEQQ